MNRRGMTLIELLVGMFIASLVAYIAFDLINDEHKNYSRTRNKVRLQSDGREAIRIIEEDLANVGFMAGLNTTAPGMSRFAARLDTCTQGLKPEDRISIVDGGGTSSDDITIRLLGITAGMVACQDNAAKIRYYVDATTKNLIREFTPAFTGGSRVPIQSTVLQNVETFQIQAGIDSAGDPYGPTATADTLWMRYDSLPAKWASSTSLTIGPLVPWPVGAPPNLPKALQIGGWTASTHSLNVNTGRSLIANSQYHVSFWLWADSGFRSMYDATEPTKNFILAGMKLGSKFYPDSVRLMLPPAAAPSFVSFYVDVPTTTSNSAQFMLKTILSKTADATQPAPKLYISGLKVVRVAFRKPNAGASTNKEDVYLWKNGTSTDSNSRRKTQAIRVWLLAKSNRANEENSQPTFSNLGNWNPAPFTPTNKNSYALYERVIPVVNNGYNPNK